MDTLQQIALFIAAGLASGTFTALFLFSIGHPGRQEFKPGRILSSYGLWILTRYEAYEARTEQMCREADKSIMEGPGSAEERVKRATIATRTIQSRRRNIYKPLGMCGYCAAPWHSAGFVFIFWFAFGLSPWLWICVPSVAVMAYALTDRLMP